MTSTDVTLAGQAGLLAAQKDFALTVTSGDGSPRALAQSILPEQYRGNPANVMIAVGLGQSMGLSPAESLYRISVIKGKPSASAELIASNVRKAGHKLRVRVTENPPSATCTIIRADDPDEPTVITRDMEWASRMGLAGEHNYKKQPSTMLSWRAITACARLACPEALYGVAYTPDEIEDQQDARPAPVVSAASFTPQQAAPEVVDAGLEPERPETDEPMTEAQKRMLFALIAEVIGGGRDAAAKARRLDYINQVLGLAGDAAITTSSDLTKAQAGAVIDALTIDKADMEATEREQAGEPA